MPRTHERNGRLIREARRHLTNTLHGEDRHSANNPARPFAGMGVCLSIVLQQVASEVPSKTKMDVR